MKQAISTIEIPIRWVDMDAYGHVNGSRYFDYFTQTRHDLLIKPFLQEYEHDFFLVDVQCHYLHALYYPDIIIISQFLEAVGTSSVELSTTIYSKTQQRICARGQATLVCCDKQTGKPCPIPQHFKTLLGITEHHPKPNTPYHLPNDLPHLNTYQFPIRWVDMDAMAHVGNTCYFDYMVETRGDLLTNFNLEQSDYHFFLTHNRCNFHTMLYYPQQITVKHYLLNISKIKTSFAYRFFSKDENTLYAEGEATLVTMSKTTHKPTKTPDRIRQYLLQYA